MHSTNFHNHSTDWPLPLIYTYRPWSHSPWCISPPNPIIHRIIAFFIVFTHKTIFHRHAIVIPSSIISPLCMDFMTKYRVLQGYQVWRAAMITHSILQRQDFIDRCVNEAAESSMHRKLSQLGFTSVDDSKVQSAHISFIIYRVPEDFCLDHSPKLPEQLLMRYGRPFSHSLHHFVYSQEHCTVLQSKHIRTIPE